MRNQHILKKIIERYLSHEATSEEKKLLDDFVSNLKDELNTGAGTINQGAVEKRLLARIKRRIDFSERRGKIVRYSSAIAAGLFLLMTIGYIAFPGLRPGAVVTVESGKRMDALSMPDGTTIYLSPHTILSYHKDFNKKQREVILEKGNAFFDVARNPQKPFVIYSGNICTRVLGTSFNISLTGHEYQVTVHTGEVKVSSGKQEVRLHKNQEAIFSDQGRDITVRELSSDQVLAWYRGDLALQQVRLEDIMQILEKKYGIKSCVTDINVLDKRLTIYIKDNTTLNSLLKQINYITNLNLIANGENEIINKE